MEWTVKQAAELTGIPADTLRYYDREGIVSPRRSEGGYRLYDESDIAGLKNIVVMKYAQFSLAEIKTMEALYTSKPGAECNEIIKDLLNKKIGELRRTIENYQNIVALMEELLPMVDSVEAYRENAEGVDRFISRIFQDIRHDTVPTRHTPPETNRNEE